jgi:hypothetical protein
MALTKVTDYVLRFNTVLNRKELRRRGYPTIVSGGGEVTPGDPLTVGLSASSTTPAVGSTVTLTASASGGVPPYTYVWTPPAGVTLSGTGQTVRTFVVPNTASPLVFRVSISDLDSRAQERSVSITPQGVVNSNARFPGHTPFRVLVGMATPSNPPPAPDWDEARSIIGQPIYEARRFASGWVSEARFDSMIGEADSANALPWISFKVDVSGTPGWAAVRDGGKNADLITLFNLCKDYGKPLLCSIHHEPASDGDLATWAKMQEFCAYFFAGYRSVSYNSGTDVITKGSYNATHDLSLNNGGNLGWGPVGNGFWWRPVSPLADANIGYPASLITALNFCKGVVGNDFYDANYADVNAANSSEAARIPDPSGVRTSTKIAHFITWARQKGVVSSGIGEYGCIDGADMLACWKIFRDNRDIMNVVNYFNSMNNSDHEWRLIPSNYPDTNYVTDSGLQDLGGNAQSQGRLNAFKTTLTESISAQYTSPL